MNNPDEENIPSPVPENEIETEAVETETPDSVVEADAPADDPAQAVTESETAEPQGDDEEKLTRTQARAANRRKRQKELEEAAQKAADERDAAKQARDRILKAGSGEKPKEEDFDNFAEFTASLAVYNINKNNVERERSAADEAEQTASKAHQEASERIKAEQISDYQQQAAEMRATAPDFDRVVGTAPLSEELQDQLLASENSAELAYAVSSDHALSKRLSSLSPMQMARELGRIEAQMQAPKPKLISKAPTPVAPVTGSGSPPRDPNSMTYAQYVAHRQKQMLGS